MRKRLGVISARCSSCPAMTIDHRKLLRSTSQMRPQYIRHLFSFGSKRNSNPPYRKICYGFRRFSQYCEIVPNSTLKRSCTKSTSISSEIDILGILLE